VELLRKGHDSGEAQDQSDAYKSTQVP